MPDLDETLDPNSLTVGELVLAAVILIAFGLAARWLRRRIRSFLLEQDGLDAYLPDVLSRAASWGVMLIGVVLALGVLGFDLGVAVLLFVLIVVIIALAGKGIMENFAAGVLLQIRGPFEVGDRIDAKGYTGVVQEINARSVVIETSDLRTVHVPNSDVLEDPIVNYTEHTERRSELAVGVAYDADVRAALGTVVAAAGAVDGVHLEPKPRAFIDEFGDSSVDLILQFWHDEGQRVEVRGRVAERVKAALDDAGIEIPFPQRVVELKADGFGPPQS